MNPAAEAERVAVRPLAAADVGPAARLHEQVLAAEFIARGGQAFLRRYYRGWMATGAELALAAVDGDGALAGVLLGSVEPAAHYRAMLRRAGPGIAVRLVGHGLVHPGFGRELVVTRALRYSRGVVRTAAAAVRGPHPRRGAVSSPPAPPGAGRSELTGEVTHVLVRPDMQGRGVARALLASAAAEARRAGLTRLRLVTTPVLARSGFYDRLGWQARGTTVSHSGEEFVAYELELGT